MKLVDFFFTLPIQCLVSVEILVSVVCVTTISKMCRIACLVPNNTVSHPCRLPRNWSSSDPVGTTIDHSSDCFLANTPWVKTRWWSKAKLHSLASIHIREISIDAPLRGVHYYRRKKEIKTSAPGGIQTYDLLSLRHVRYKVLQFQGVEHFSR